MIISLLNLEKNKTAKVVKIEGRTGIKKVLDKFQFLCYTIIIKPYKSANRCGCFYEPTLIGSATGRTINF